MKRKILSVPLTLWASSTFSTIIPNPVPGEAMAEIKVTAVFSDSGLVQKIGCV